MPDAPDPAALVAALREHLPDDAVDTNAAAYAVSGLTPVVLVSPSTPEELATVLSIANQAGAAVIPGSAGTQMHLGMPPRHYDIALYVGRLDRVIEYEPADLTVTVEAGLPLSQLQGILGANGQWLPLDPPVAGGATIGGILATNASGPARYRYGTARDLLIGVTFALPSGDLVKSGGRVVKNVAGYDLGKLQIGALGTLGVITQATFKVAPVPARVDLGMARGPLATLMSITRRLADALLSVEGVTLSKDAAAPDWRLRVRFAGGVTAVERSVRDFAAFVKGAGAKVDAEPEAQADAGLEEAPLAARASVLPTALPTICEAFVAVGASITAYPTAGVVHGAWTADGIQANQLLYLRRLCVDAGRGALVLERASTELKREVDVWGDAPASFELMRRIKAELDPNAILNPGRFVGGI
ncbi:MAG TPA: FAD-binding oxidoreductase [Dehalococcoidia bacterium]|nr:FAD-binding oxidoreductase [Dehalococcoidia bacterium]